MRADQITAVPLSHYLDGPIRNGFSPPESAEWTGIQMLGLGCLTPGGFQPRQLKNAPAGIGLDHAALLKDGDLLMSRANTRDLVGLAGRYQDIGNPCIYPDLMMRLRPAANCLPGFLEQLLRSASVRRGIMAAAQGTSESMVKLSAPVLAGLRVPLFSLDSQRRIVEVLDGVAEVVRATEASIAKRRSLRGDIFADLVSEDWDGERLSDMVRLPSGQVDPREMPYREQTLLAPDHVESRTGRVVGRETAESQGAISGKYVVQPGDVVLSKIRPALRKVALADFEGTCSADMYPMRVTSKVLPGFLWATLLSEDFSRFAESVSGRTGIPKLNRKDLALYSMRVPPLSDQQRIIETLDSWDSKVANDENEVQKLRLLKRGLVDDLLSGRVRIGQ